jgi:pyruvate kinase
MTTRDAKALLAALLERRRETEIEAAATIRRWRPRIDREEFLPSALNLARYLALRRHDLRPLQTSLMPWGLSSLGRLESRVLANMDAVIATLGPIAGAPAEGLPERPPLDAFFEGERALERSTVEVFGPARGRRHVRIMVTLSSEAARDPAFARRLVEAGADCFRINCAHDSRDEWSAMIANVRHAERSTRRTARIAMDLAGQKPRTEDVLRPDGERRLRPGDAILLTAGPTGTRREPPFQARCSIPEVLPQLRAGVPITFDDGRMATVVERVEHGDAVLDVTATRPGGGVLRDAQGLNFPGVALALEPLTPKDLADLDFVAAHADIVGYSFVQRPSDVAQLQRHLAARGDRLPALMAKIETAEAVRNLPDLIVQAAGRQPFVVMIARGDLAVELGYLRLAEIQEEILWLCEAARVPVVWATEVLDRLARKGTPTRAEITDAAMAERAECVMLNKGPHIEEAVTTLDDLLTRMQGHQSKKTPQLRALHSWEHLATG